MITIATGLMGAYLILVVLGVVFKRDRLRQHLSVV